jgi:hypothetical protein
MCIEKKEKKKKKKKERGMARQKWSGWIKWKINKVQGRMSRCWEMKLPLFSNDVQSDNEDVIGAS